MAEAAAKKADLAAQKSLIAGGKAEKAADRAKKAAEKTESASNKTESVFLGKNSKPFPSPPQVGRETVDGFSAILLWGWTKRDHKISPDTQRNF